MDIFHFIAWAIVGFTFVMAVIAALSNVEDMN